MTARFIITNLFAHKKLLQAMTAKPDLIAMKIIFIQTKVNCGFHSQSENRTARYD